MNTKTNQKIASKVRKALRYPWAAAMIPFGLAMGVGGLVQHAVRSVVGRK